MRSCAGAGDRNAERRRAEDGDGVTTIFLVRDRAASGVILRPLLSITPGGDPAALAAASEEVATENAAAEDAPGASSKPMLKMIDVGRLL